MRIIQQAIERKLFTYTDGGLVRSVVELVILPDLFGQRPVGYIHKVYTDHPFQGKGIASGLMREALDAAEKMGCYKVFLVCDDKNVGFYQRLGFKVEQLGMVLRL